MNNLGVLASIGRLLRPRKLRCSFCRRGAAHATRLVGGASGYICDGCVAKCVAVLEQHGGMAPPTPAPAN